MTRMLIHELNSIPKKVLNKIGAPFCSGLLQRTNDILLEIRRGCMKVMKVKAAKEILCKDCDALHSILDSSSA